MAGFLGENGKIRLAGVNEPEEWGFSRMLDGKRVENWMNLASKSVRMSG
jgi:endonuclease YncB( thermonuclease family)